MTLSVLALIVCLISFFATVILINDEKKFQSEIRESFKKVVDIENKFDDRYKYIQPLIDKHNEEQEQKEIETRRKHWKSFNKWKMQKEMMNEDAGYTPICGACYNDSLELDVDYKESVEKSMYAYDGYHIKKDYPLSAEQKCTACGHIVDKWKYEE